MMTQPMTRRQFALLMSETMVAAPSLALGNGIGGPGDMAGSDEQPAPAGSEAGAPVYMVPQCTWCSGSIPRTTYCPPATTPQNALLTFCPIRECAPRSSWLEKRPEYLKPAI